MINLSDVLVVCGATPGGSPARCSERWSALRRYRLGDPGEYSFWYAPRKGEMSQLTGPDEINWNAS